MNRFKYMRLKFSDLPNDIIKQQPLQNNHKDSYVYIKVRKGTYGLLQAGILTQELLEKWLNKKWYQQSKLTPRFWKYSTPATIAMTHHKSHQRRTECCVSKSSSFCISDPPTSTMACSENKSTSKGDLAPEFPLTIAPLMVKSNPTCSKSGASPAFTKIKCCCTSKGGESVGSQPTSRRQVALPSAMAFTKTGQHETSKGGNSAKGQRALH